MVLSSPNDKYAQKSKYEKQDNHEKFTPITAAEGVGETLKILEGRWKLLILFHLFGGKVMRFSDLELSIPGITQKMLTQQLRSLESDGIIYRKAYPEVPPRVEYKLTTWGQELCPTLDSLLKWASKKPASKKI